MYLILTDGVKLEIYRLRPWQEHLEFVSLVPDGNTWVLYVMSSSGEKREICKFSLR